jgi:hypothetical protein
MYGNMRRSVDSEAPCRIFDQILDPTVIHYIQDMVQRKAVLVEYLPTYEKIVDVLTEPLAKSKFKYFCDKIGVECPSR